MLYGLLLILLIFLILNIKFFNTKFTYVAIMEIRLHVKDKNSLFDIIRNWNYNSELHIEFWKMCIKIF